jgi:hypothetical protein
MCALRLTSMSYRVHGICFVCPADEACAYRISSPFLPLNRAIRIVFAVVHASPGVSSAYRYKDAS